MKENSMQIIYTDLLSGDKSSRYASSPTLEKWHSGKQYTSKTTNSFWILVKTIAWDHCLCGNYFHFRWMAERGCVSTKTVRRNLPINKHIMKAKNERSRYQAKSFSKHDLNTLGQFITCLIFNGASIVHVQISNHVKAIAGNPRLDVNNISLLLNTTRGLVDSDLYYEAANLTISISYLFQ